MDKSPPPSDSARFRANATRVYRVVCLALISIPFGAGWLGWHFGGWLWLSLGFAAGFLLAAAVLLAATLIYAMSQDGG